VGGAGQSCGLAAPSRCLHFILIAIALAALSGGNETGRLTNCSPVMSELLPPHHLLCTLNEKTIVSLTAVGMTFLGHSSNVSSMMAQRW
jgi:hypothetical protein